MRLLALLEYAAVVIGIVAVIAGRFFALHNGVDLGLVVIGAGVALGGIEGVLTRRMPFRAADDAYEAYAGTPALIIAALALAAGAAAIGAGYLLSQGTWHATVSHLLRRPAPLLAGGGLVLIALGVLMMLNPLGRTGWAWRLLVYVPRWLTGLAVVAMGVAAIGLGAWQWLQPQAFDRFAAQWRPVLSHPLEYLRH